MNFKVLLYIKIIKKPQSETISPFKEAIEAFEALSIRDCHSYTLPDVRTDVRVTKEGRLTSKAGQAGQTLQIPRQAQQGSDLAPGSQNCRHTQEMPPESITQQAEDKAWGMRAGPVTGCKD